MRPRSSNTLQSPSRTLVSEPSMELDVPRESASGRIRELSKASGASVNLYRSTITREASYAEQTQEMDGQVGVDAEHELLGHDYYEAEHDIRKAYNALEDAL
ncbi:hypothetical protein HK097_005412, partial [Rhizophlyctis rosea]